MNRKQIPTNIFEADRRTEVKPMVKFSWDELHDFQSEAAIKLEEFANYLENLMNSALDAEQEAVKNKKMVNRWYQRNEGYKRFSEPNRAESQGYLSFIYLQPNEGFYFFDDSMVLQEVVTFMITYEKIVYFGEINHQGTLHKAWTTKRNYNILKES